MRRRTHTAPLFFSLLTLAIAAPIHAEEDGDLKKTRAQLEKLLSKGDIKKATALADKTFGKTWCESSEEKSFSLASTLGVLARRAKRYDTALTCSYQAHLLGDSAQRLGATYYELSRITRHAKLEDLSELSSWDTECSLEGYDVNDLIEKFTSEDSDGKNTLTKANRKKLEAALLTKSFAMWPRQSSAKRLAKTYGVKREALIAILTASLHLKLDAHGPFASTKEAKAAAKKNKTKGSAKRSKDLAFKASSFRFSPEECEESAVILLEIDGAHYYAITTKGLYTTGEECGGYGEEYDISDVSWVKEGALLTASFKEQSYINTGCGPSSNNTKITYYCGLDAKREPVCLQFADIEYAIGDRYPIDYSQGVKASFDKDGKFSFDSAKSPKEVAKIFASLEGKTISEVHAGAREGIAKYIDDAIAK